MTETLSQKDFLFIDFFIFYFYFNLSKYSFSNLRIKYKGIKDKDFGRKVTI